MESVEMLAGPVEMAWAIFADEEVPVETHMASPGPAVETQCYSLPATVWSHWVCRRHCLYRHRVGSLRTQAALFFAHRTEVPKESRERSLLTDAHCQPDLEIYLERSHRWWRNHEKRSSWVPQVGHPTLATSSPVS